LRAINNSQERLPEKIELLSAISRDALASLNFQVVWSRDDGNEDFRLFGVSDNFGLPFHSRGIIGAENRREIAANRSFEVAWATIKSGSRISFVQKVGILFREFREFM
jgi:hypothetical protein